MPRKPVEPVEEPTLTPEEEERAKQIADAGEPPPPGPRVPAGCITRRGFQGWTEVVHVATGAVIDRWPPFGG